MARIDLSHPRTISLSSRPTFSAVLGAYDGDERENKIVCYHHREHNTGLLIRDDKNEMARNRQMNTGINPESKEVQKSLASAWRREIGRFVTNQPEASRVRECV